MTVPGKALIGLCDQDPGQAEAGGLAGTGPVYADQLNAAQDQGVHHHGQVQAAGGAQQEPRPTLHRLWHFPV